uniref:2.7 kDa salivary protein n=1 Tax=Phlebotomus perniciosus TaxID=13204 RepID=Q0ZS30_PHLPE|nr:2.7 kDa salivary protein [Phlebotomus perniciosus]
MKYFSLNFLLIVILLIVACSPQLPCLPQDSKKKPSNPRPKLSARSGLSY